MISQIFAFIVVFMTVTMAHELGHFIYARKAGIRVLEFGIGYGPRIYAFKRKNTTYSINLFPIAGFVRLAGMDDQTEEDRACPEEEKYQTKPAWQRFRAIAAGPVFNILLCFAIIYLVLISAGLPTGISSQVATVTPRSPAARAGLRPGDQILAVNAKEMPMDKIISLIHESPGKELRLRVRRGSSELSMATTPVYHPKMKMALIGFSPRPIYTRINPFRAIYLSLQQTLGMVVLIISLLGQLLAGRLSVFDLAGPVGIAQITSQFASHGILALFSFIAFLSVNLGVANLLPLPALDGGHLFFLLLEIIRGKPLPAEKENLIHRIGLAVLLCLLAIITLNDVSRFFR